MEENGGEEKQSGRIVGARIVVGMPKEHPRSFDRYRTVDPGETEKKIVDAGILLCGRV